MTSKEVFPIPTPRPTPQDAEPFDVHSYVQEVRGGTEAEDDRLISSWGEVVWATIGVLVVLLITFVIILNVFRLAGALVL